MTLRTDLTDTMKEAMKAKDETTTAAVRLIIAELKLLDVNARGAGKTQADDSEIFSMMQKMIKQRQESLKIFNDNGRPELAAKEQAEIVVIEKFLPKQMGDEETAAVIKALVAELGATSIKDMGKVMAEVKARYAGQIDGGKASSFIKTTLSA